MAGSALSTGAKPGSSALLYTVPAVLYGLFRYLFPVHRHELGGSPARTPPADSPLILCVLIRPAAAAAVITLR